MLVKEKLESVKDELISAYLEGESTVKLGERYGCNGGSVWSFLRSNGVELRCDKRVKKDYPVELIKKHLLDGKSLYWISKELKVHKRILSEISKEIGLDPQRNSKVRDEPLGPKFREIIADYESGLGCEKLARKYGCASSSILKVLKEHGVDPSAGK